MTSPTLSSSTASRKFLSLFDCHREGAASPAGGPSRPLPRPAPAPVPPRGAPLRGVGAGRRMDGATAPPLPPLGDTLPPPPTDAPRPPRPKLLEAEAPRPRPRGPSAAAGRRAPRERLRPAAPRRPAAAGRRIAIAGEHARTARDCGAYSVRRGRRIRSAVSGVHPPLAPAPGPRGGSKPSLNPRQLWRAHVAAHPAATLPAPYSPLCVTIPWSMQRCAFFLRQGVGMSRAR